MTRKGYSLFRRAGKGAWYVAWTDGTGKRRTEKASNEKGVAHEIGRQHAQDADRVRRGIISPRESRAIDQGRHPIGKHIDEFRSALKQRGNVAAHYNPTRARCKRIVKVTQIRHLGDITQEKIQRALKIIADDSTAQTALHYFRAFRGFVCWCVQVGRMTSDPLAGLKPPKVKGEAFSRTPISADNLPELIRVTKTRQGRERHKAVDRAMFYMVMAYTGLRKGETASLKPEDIDLHGNLITVRAAYSKNARQDSQPIPADVAAELRAWLTDKKPGNRLFNFGPRWNCEEIFRADCAAVGIVPVEGERLGVHSLRRCYITAAIRAGGLAVAQDMARHSTPVLTKKYSDLDMADYRKALAGLPPVKDNAAHEEKKKKIG